MSAPSEDIAGLFAQFGKSLGPARSNDGTSGSLPPAGHLSA